MKRIQDRRIAWTLAMGLILIAILVLDGFSFSPEDAGAAEVPAPEFNVGMLTGEMYTSAMLKGQATLLAFWAPWCHVCQRELPGLAEFAEHDKPSTLRILSVGFADSRGHVENFVNAP